LFWIIPILTGVRWYSNVVSICISLMAMDVEHFFVLFWPFELPLTKICSVHLLDSSLGH
jgi:hypothetical protein